MSDTSYAAFQHYGTNAQRVAFTPSPGGGQPIYVWYATDTGLTWVYDTTWHQITSVGVLPASVQGDTIYASGTNAWAALAKDANATRYLSNTGSSNNPAWAAVNLANGTTGALATTKLGAGAQVQRVNTQTGAVSTGTTVLPFDDTIPQNTEGNEVMTLAITPTSATNILEIQAIANVANSANARYQSAALFQDTTANALSAVAQYSATGGEPVVLTLLYQMVAGTTSATTFKVRAGGHGAGTMTFNGVTSARIFGGVYGSSITIREIAV